MIKLTGADAPKGYKKVTINGLHIQVVKDDGSKVDLNAEGLSWGYQQPVIKRAADLEKAVSSAVFATL